MVYMTIETDGDVLRLTRSPPWPRGYIVPVLGALLALYFALREVDDQDSLTRWSAVVVVFLASLTFIEDTQRCNVVRGASPRVEIRREGPFDGLLGTEGVKVFPGNVTSVTVAAERLRYFADGRQLRLELDECPTEVLVTGSCTLDPLADHLAVAHAVCGHVGLNPASAVDVEKTQQKPTKEHAS